ncbi:MAG TPA: hypothetical protein VFE62_27635 [Gemmataceae bacterium]|nr:hypothetical protein [Gemmataceae bacterium]
MHRFPSAFALLSLAGICVSVGSAQEKAAPMISVKYDRLKQEVLKHRGKLVLVDFWAGY